MHSLGGLIHADHRTPSLDYDMVLRVTLALTRNIQEAEKVYALACFNVLAHNRDDHVKNFSFLLNARNEWIFAPAYDLTFSYGPVSYTHLYCESLMFMGKAGDIVLYKHLSLIHILLSPSASFFLDEMACFVRRADD